MVPKPSDQSQSVGFANGEQFPLMVRRGRRPISQGLLAENFVCRRQRRLSAWLAVARSRSSGC